MADEKKGLHKNATFIGKELGSKGTKKDGSEWVLFKTKFHCEGDQSARTFNVFAPLTKTTHQLKDLEEGKIYRISYSEEVRQRPGTDEEYTAKTIYFIDDPKEQSKVDEMVNKTKVNLDFDTEFVKAYFGQLQKDKQNIAHFVAVYVKKTNVGLFSKLEKLFNDNNK